MSVFKALAVTSCFSIHEFMGVDVSSNILVVTVSVQSDINVDAC